MAEHEVEAFLEGEAVTTVARFMGREWAQRIAARALVRVAGKALARVSGKQAAGDLMSNLGAVLRQKAAKQMPIGGRR